MVLKRYMHSRERYFAMLNDNRKVLPFEWGAELVSGHLNGHDPREVLLEAAAKAVANSDEYFALAEPADIVLENRLHPSGATMSAEELKDPPPQVELPVVTWQSAVRTSSEENNKAHAVYFPHPDRRAAVIILPHWNAKAGTYFDLAKFFNRVGLSALRVTLPYHEERMPAELDRADHLVSPNIGRSLQSMRQAVVDTRTAVHWLKQQGYDRVGIVGTSIGSCVAFLAFLHDPLIDAAVYNHVSGYMADVVWHGLSTYHVRDGFGENVTLEELRVFWAPVSPMVYLDRLERLPPRPQRFIYTLYDLSFPIELTRDVFRELRRRKIPHSEVSIPCGHYTLGEKPWVYLDGYKIISYLRQHLK